MNVLIVSPDLGSGGVGSVVQNLTSYLRSRGHCVRMFYSGSSVFARHRTSQLGFPAVDHRLQAPFGERHPAVSLAAFGIFFPIGLLQLVWRIWRWRIRVVNIHYPTDNLFYFALCRRILKLTLVCSIHGADLFPTGKPQARYSRSMRMLLRHADRIVAPSEDCRRKLAGVFPEYSGKIVFIHNGIDLAEFVRAPEETPSTSKRRYILSVSAYKEQKGLDVLIRAMATVVERNADVNLVLVGEGPLREDLESLSRKLAVADRIEFHGRRSHREVIELLYGCEVFVLPSRFETFGIALVEAMACGRPVVAAKAGGMPEIVQDGVNGVLVEPEDPSGLADALNSLLGNPGFCRRLGVTAREDAHRRFPAATMGAAYERVFQVNSGASADAAGIDQIPVLPG